MEWWRAGSDTREFRRSLILLVAFAFLAGIVTILSPCILPVLPIILSTVVADGEKKRDVFRPLGVVTGFILSFTFFTLFLSTIVSRSGLDADLLRDFAVIVIGVFGLSMLFPQVTMLLERMFSYLSRFVPSGGRRKDGYGGGLIVGLSIGLLWTPCVGPILASVITLAITGTVTIQAVLITLAYAVGTAIPMFAIIYGGQGLLKRMPWLTRNTQNIQMGFGVVMIAMAVAIYFNLDRQFQTYVLNKFPNYGSGLTSLEDNKLIEGQLNRLGGRSGDEKLGMPTYEMLEPKGILAPELIQGGEWFNSEPLRLDELRGKVVVIDFWTYTCINCQRTLPYLRDWWEKYSDKGLVIIGVHSPEFEFEKSAENVLQAIEDFGLEYPVMQDNNFATWRAYNNRYWPAKYFIDKDGYVRYTHFGEGAYDESERVIQELLQEAGNTVDDEINNPGYSNFSRTPETYLGYGRISNFASKEKILPDQSREYSFPSILGRNSVAYQGAWIVTEEYAKPEIGAELKINFEAKEVYLVMRSSNGDESRVNVYVDDEAQYFGSHNEDGTVYVNEDMLYKLLKLPIAGRHELRLEFPDGNVELYAFTFG